MYEVESLSRKKERKRQRKKESDALSYLCQYDLTKFPGPFFIFDLINCSELSLTPKIHLYQASAISMGNAASDPQKIRDNLNDLGHFPRSHVVFMTRRRAL